MIRGNHSAEMGYTYRFLGVENPGEVKSGSLI